MIFKDAIRSLLNDYVRSFFYWLTFVLTSMFIFLFFNISMSDTLAVTFIDSRNDMTTNVTIFIIIVASIDIFFANDFFVKSKSKSLAVQLICGGKYTQLASFLLIQTFILLMLALPPGIIAALGLIPLLNTVLNNFMSSEVLISVVPEALVHAVVVLVYVVFWTTFLNLSFAYKNMPNDLMNEQRITVKQNPPLVDLQLLKKRTKKIIASVMFAAPVILLLFNPEAALLLCLISLFGLNSCYKSIALPYLDRYIETKAVNEPVLLTSLGFVRGDLKAMKKNLILFLLTAVMLISFMVSAEKALDVMLITMSYIILNTMQSLALMFTHQTIVVSRIRNFLTLEQIGYMKNDLKKVILNEMIYFYGFVILCGLIYFVPLYAGLLIRHLISFAFVLILLLGYIIPLVISGLICGVYYDHMIFGKQEGKGS